MKRRNRRKPCCKIGTGGAGIKRRNRRKPHRESAPAARRRESGAQALRRLAGGTGMKRRNKRKPCCKIGTGGAGIKWRNKRKPCCKIGTGGAGIKWRKTRKPRREHGTCGSPARIGSAGSAPARRRLICKGVCGMIGSIKEGDGERNGNNNGKGTVNGIRGAKAVR